MPIDHDPLPAAVPIEVAPSAPVELSSLLCTCSSTRPPKFDIPHALADDVNGFWQDGYPSLAEVVVLADATDTVRDTQVDRFLERLRDPVLFPERPALETEPDDERTAIYERLDRLASDRRFRTRYVALMRELWATFDDTWHASGLARAEAVAASWSTQLTPGADALDLFPEGHIARRDEYPRMVRRAQREGTLRLCPSVAGYGLIVALPGTLLVSGDALAPERAVSRREAATKIADRLRTLSDPTRLTILSQLARAPVSVSEVARVLHIAQPTASVHLRQLREAGLVTADHQGTRTVYTVRPAAVDELLAEVGEGLSRVMSH